MAFYYKYIQKMDCNNGTLTVKILRVFLWVLDLFLLSYVTLSPYPAQVDPMAWSNFHNAIFIAISRPLFILALMLMMGLLFTSDRNWLMRMLQHSVWLPLSRLSYVVYLVFPIVNATLLSSMPSSLVLSYYTMFFLISYSLMASFTVALLVYIFVENPIRHLLSFRRGTISEW